MTDDKLTKSNAALAAAPPKGEAQPLRARGRRVGRLETAVPRGPLTSGQQEDTSLPTPDRGHPKRVSVRRVRDRRCQKKVEVIMREHNHGESGSPLPVTPVVAEWVERTAAVFGVALTGDPGRGGGGTTHGRAVGVIPAALTPAVAARIQGLVALLGSPSGVSPPAALPPPSGTAAPLGSGVSAVAPAAPVSSSRRNPTQR